MIAQRKIAIIGLGYVGLPLALAFGEVFEEVVGFDIDAEKVRRYCEGVDCLDDGLEEALLNTSVRFSSDAASLQGADFFVVGVPTPIDEQKRPDLKALRAACRSVAEAMNPGAIVVFESTVYPGVTEEVCVPILEQVSGLTWKKDFFVGYSPERVNPGDHDHTITKITKVVSGDTPKTLQIVGDVYAAVVTAGVHRAPSIKVAEAAKVIENTQRDLNIALMNELSIIFDKMGIPTTEVLDAAATKWNFNRYTPGLVGGHCIGVDPYYLTTKAEELGYHPQVILAGRRINDTMGVHVAQRIVKLLGTSGFRVLGSRVGVLGITFKENVSDTRNSRIPDMVGELKEFGVEVKVTDPRADAEEVALEYGIELVELDAMRDLDVLVLAVPHEQYLDRAFLDSLPNRLHEGGIIVDIKGVFDSDLLRDDLAYWSL